MLMYLTERFDWWSVQVVEVVGIEVAEVALHQVPEV
jgi:hypothetical protein